MNPNDETRRYATRTKRQHETTPQDIRHEMTLDEDDTLFWSSFFMSMEGQRNSVGSGSTAPLTSLIWPGIAAASFVCFWGNGRIKEALKAKNPKKYKYNILKRLLSVFFGACGKGLQRICNSPKLKNGVHRRTVRSVQLF